MLSLKSPLNGYYTIMKKKPALISFGLITFGYMMVLIWVDSRNQIFTELPGLLSLLPILISLSFLSYLIRYLRWYWLLSRAGNKTKVFSGYLAYLAGFAFTATPGKLGELLRIRYLAPQGVPPWRVIAAFVYERAFDLLAVLFLASLAISQNNFFFFVLGFVVILLAVLIFVALNPAWLNMASVYMRFYRLNKLARVCRILRDGLAGCRIWVTLPDILVSIVLGVLAWSITSFSFVWLLSQLSVSIPVLSALSIYPLSMLAGAASMLPGGIGSTEATIVVLLSLFDVPLATAALAAIGIRFSSMWFAVLCGFIALSTLEYLFHRTDKVRFSEHGG